jgi:3-hydroxyisobutyrate dehydrogenase
MSREQIGFIGLGSQGGPMAHRIIDAGMNLSVWARRPQVTASFVDKGAKAAPSVAELGQHCDHVGVCVVNDDDVNEICADLIPSMRPGSRIAIHSTILPESCARLEQRCADRSIGLIDAPVSGGQPAAGAGTLTVMCGGSKAVFDASRPVFQTFGKLIVWLGVIGSGQRAKIINNALLAANLGVAAAAVTAADELNIDRTALIELIKVSSGRSMGFEVASRLSAPSAFAHGAKILTKDVALLKTLLPDSGSAEALRAAGADFLATARA